MFTTLPSKRFTLSLIVATFLSLIVAISCAIALCLLIARNNVYPNTIKFQTEPHIIRPPHYKPEDSSHQKPNDVTNQKESGNGQTELLEISDTLSKYMVGGPQSKLGIYPKAAVATDAAPCADIARDVLKEGGTAVDGAIAALVCNGAVHSHSMGLGGGFFMTIFNKTRNETYFLNAREVAPSYATKDMFINNNITKANPEKGVYSIGVPGEILGYFEAKERYGNKAISMERLFKPTIKLCEEGITVSRSLSKAIKSSEEWIRKDSGLRTLFIDEITNQTLTEGRIIKRPNLAGTLRQLHDKGYKAFYEGELGRKVIDELQKLGSRMTLKDLSDYRVRWQTPQQGTLQNGYKIYSSPPPGSGVIVQSILKLYNKLSFFPMSAMDADLRLIESFKFAFAQRSKLGDTFNSSYKSEIEKVTKEIVSNEWIQMISDKINSMNATSTEKEFYWANQSSPKDDHGTTHISVIASNGDAVGVTSTINYLFGSGIMSPSTGIIFNDQMDDFATRDEPNIYGLEPSKYNRIRPGARPMSSMSPTIITDSNNNVVLVIGASGGPRIISAVASTTINHLMYNRNIKEAIDFPRLHHQWLPMRVDAEVGFSKETIKKIESFGHKVKLFDPYYPTDYSGARVQAIAVNRNTSIITANNDRRKSGGVSGY